MDNWKMIAVGFVAAGLFAPACSSGGGGGGKAIQSVRADGTTITLATNTGQLKAGGNDLVVTARGAGNQQAGVNMGSIRFYMPPMGSMAAMTAEAPLEPAGQPGVFKGKVDLPMNGTWQTTITFADDKGPHRAVLSVSAR